MSHPPQTPRPYQDKASYNDGGFGGTGSVHPTFLKIYYGASLTRMRALAKYIIGPFTYHGGLPAML